MSDATIAPALTTDDVELLKAAAFAAREDDHYFAGRMGYGDWHPGREEEIAQRYDALAARIAALLPKPGS